MNARAVGWSARRTLRAAGETARTNWLDPVARGFWRRRPWITRFEIEGRPYGGDAELLDDSRVDQFVAAFPSARTVLELGSLEGGHSFSLARRGLTVVAVEGRPANVEKARFVKSLLSVDGVSFVCADLEVVPLESFGSFDAVFCAGLLYHLRRPWRLLDQLASVAPNVLLQTHYAAEPAATHEGLPGAWYGEFGLRDPLSGLSSSSFWLTLPALMDRLRSVGFDVDVLEHAPDHPNGPSITLAGRR